MADQLYLPPAEDGNGNRLPAAIAYFYLTGTTTPVTVYQSNGVTAIGTSVTADANGVFQQVFTTSGSAIKINVTTALGAAVPGYPQDPAIRVAGSNGQAAQVSFAPTVSIPETNVQDAIEAVDAKVEATSVDLLAAGSLSAAGDSFLVPAGFTDVRILLQSVQLSSNNLSLNLQVGTGTLGSPTWVTSSDYGLRAIFSTDTTVPAINSTSSAISPIPGLRTTGGPYANNAEVTLSGFNALLPLSGFLNTSLAVENGGSASNRFLSGGIYVATARTHTLLRLVPSSGTITSGTYRIIGTRAS